nr:hypothetical protein GCM10025732_32780 [Glycomyces mayteni]
MLLLALYPIYFVVIASVSDPTMVATGRVWIVPRDLSWFGYEQILADDRIWNGYRNTLLYAVAGTALNLLVTMPAAFTLSRRSSGPGAC